MNTKKIALILSAALTLTTISPNSAYAYTSNGWSNSNGVWYYYQNGSIVTGWKSINGNCYYLNSDGAMDTGWKYVNNDWYYLNNSGAMETGLQSINGDLYYLNDSGAMEHDTIKTIDGVEYSIDSNGVCTKTIDNSTYSKGINQFTSSFASELLYNEDKGKNNICSPVSAYMALSVLSGGADKQTKDELLKVLNAANSENFSKEVNELRNSLTFKNEENMCSLANSIWICNRPEISNYIKINDDNISKIAQDYKAEVFKADLSSEEGAKEKAKWISDNTKGKLGQDYGAFVSDKETVMEIFNTLYFNDKWDDEFSKGMTQKEDFTLDDNKTVKVDFMNKDSIQKAYENNEYKVSSLPFKSGNKMVFILPKGDKTPYDILNNGKKLNDALSSNNAIDKEVHFKVPKFEIKKLNSLNNTMERLGLKEMYKPEANFSKFVTYGNLCVSNIVQDTYMTIDEEGVEAAAYTQIEMGATCPAPQPEPEYEKMELNLDRPFIFAIMSRNDNPLFIGVMNNPKVK